LPKFKQSLLAGLIWMKVLTCTQARTRRSSKLLALPKKRWLA
jgi:hypothetical protein